MAGKPRNLGLSYIDKTGVRRWREWRGIKDTLVDYGWWCVMWKDMIKFVLQSPLQVVKGIFRYRWMLTYLTLPQFIDRQLEGMRGVQLRAGHALYDIIIKHTIDIIADSFNADQNIGGKNRLPTASSALTSLFLPSLWQASRTSLAFLCRPYPSSCPR